MSVCYTTTALTVHFGDCLDILPRMPEASVHAVVTDPPYGMHFMGQNWDAPWRSGRDIGRSAHGGMREPEPGDGTHRLPWPLSGPHANVRCRRCRRRQVSSGPCRCAIPDFPNHWAAAQRSYQDWCARWAAECLRVLKPGGHLVAFGGTRTYHRMACAIEDSGFEVRDSLHWLYGQGFPKSLNVAKAIDKAGRGVPHGAADPASSNHGKYKTQATEGRRAAGDMGRGYDAGPGQYMAGAGATDTIPMLTPAAQEWDGWGTALKPAHEPILLARKLFAGTVARNVAAHRCGALHIDACRTGHRRQYAYTVTRWKPGATLNRAGGPWRRDDMNAPSVTGTLPPGRWPANVLFTHTPSCSEDAPCVQGCPVAELDAQAGTRRSGANPARRHANVFATVYGQFPGMRDCTPARGAEAGSAARFFPVFRYQPKTSAAERPCLPGITHPTVKPLDLMRWLVRLVTPPGGIVLDPFAGTGTTLHACMLEGMRGIGMEQDPRYIELCKTRLATYLQPPSPPRTRA